TVLHLAAYSGHQATVEYLVGLGVDLSSRTKKGNTALNLAIQCGHSDVAAFLQAQVLAHSV
ncbi:hypothetical protein BDN72DRAFT_778096, partial [Pluteus cervinus]